MSSDNETTQDTAAKPEAAVVEATKESPPAKVEVVSPLDLAPPEPKPSFDYEPDEPPDEKVAADVEGLLSLGANEPVGDSEPIEKPEPEPKSEKEPTQESSTEKDQPIQETSFQGPSSTETPESVIETPAPAQEAETPADESEDKDETIRQLRETIAKMAGPDFFGTADAGAPTLPPAPGAEQTPAQPVPQEAQPAQSQTQQTHPQQQTTPPEQQQPAFVLDQETFRSAFDSPEAFQALIDRLADERVQKSYQAVLGNIPSITAAQITQHYEARVKIDDFYRENPDLAGYRELVGRLATTVQREHTDWSVPQILDESARKARDFLRLKKTGRVPSGAGQPAQPQKQPKEQRPAFAPAPGSARPNSSASRQTRDAQIADIDRLFNA